MSNFDIRQYIEQLIKERWNAYRREIEHGDRLGAVIAKDAYIEACRDILAGVEDND